MNRKDEMCCREYDPYVYWNGLFSSRVDLSTVGHPELGAYNQIAYHFRLAALRETIADLLPILQGLRVFEAAFGVGFYLKFYAESGVTQLTGVDLSSVAVARAKEMFPQYHLFQHDITVPLPIPAKSFDLVTAIDVLYHIVDDLKWEHALDHLCSLIAPNGVFVFTDKFPRQQAYQTFPHVRRRPLEMYAAVFRGHGLTIKTIRPVFVFMDDPLPEGEPRWLAHMSFAQWRIVSKAIRVFSQWQSVRDVVGLSLGALQYPFEKMALGLLPRSPNLEMVLAQRSSE